MASASSTRDWSGLPYDLADKILDHLHEFGDFSSFCFVCRSWCYCALKLHDNTPSDRIRFQQNIVLLHNCRNKLPLLLLMPDEAGKHGLFSVAERGVVGNIELPVPYSDLSLIGSSDGLLFSLSVISNSDVITLINPFLNETSPLPQLSDHNSRRLVFRKGIFCSSSSANTRSVPTDEDCQIKGTSEDLGALRKDNGVLILYGDYYLKVAHYRSGGAWTVTSAFCRNIQDIISYKGEVYGVDHQCKLMKVDVNDSCPMWKTLVQPLRGKKDGRPHLVESQEGDLLLVLEYRNGSEVNKVEVYTLSKLNNEMIWNPTNNLQKQALFLSEKFSSSVSTIEFPACKANYIYFTDISYDL